MNVTQAVQKLSHDDEAERDRALQVLMADKQGAIHALVASLQGPLSSKALPRMVKLLAAFEAHAAVSVLLDLLERGTPGYDDRAAIAQALGELATPKHATDPRLRRHALTLSRELLAPTRAAVLPLLLLVGDEACDERLKIMAALDADPEVKRRARDALIELRNRRHTTSLTSSPSPSPSSSPSSPSSPSPSPSSSSPSLSSPSPSVSAAIPAGSMAIDFAALMSSSSGTLPVTQHPPIPAGGLAFDFEAMVKQMVKQQAAAPPSTTAAPAPLDPTESLLRRLRNPRWAERALAIEEVVARGSAIVPLLVERLGPDTQARMGICLALTRLQATEAASALLMVATSAAHTSEERDVQAVALKALANSLTGAEEGISGPLLPLLRSPDPFVRAGAIVCLGRLADRVGARAATLLLASDPDEEVRKAAAIAVSESVREDHEDLVAPLLATLTAVPRPSAEGQEAILIALARIEVTQVALKVRIRHSVRPLVFGFTAAQRRLAITVLESCYSEEDPPPVWVVEDVLDRIADPAPETRLVAASFVARFLPAGFSHAVDRLEDALDRGERAVSLLALEALRRHDTPLAQAALSAVADVDADQDVKDRAQTLLFGFQARSTEWTSSANVQSPALAAPSPSPSTPSARGGAAALPHKAGGRVRPAGSSAQVVVAKDGDAAGGAVVFVDDVTRPLAARLLAVTAAQAAGQLDDEGVRIARRRILEQL